MEFSQRDLKRFWSKVEKSSGCWTWIAGTFTHGYGVFQWHGKARQAHRVSYTLSNGPIPDGMVVMHTCDNPPCVNPKHLVLGTQIDNIRDRDNKGRWRGSGRRGETMPTSKLTEAQVIEIRERYSSGLVMQKELAEEYGISKAQMSNILCRKAWPHI